MNDRTNDPSKEQSTEMTNQ